MTKPAFFRASCDVTGCSHVTVFTCLLDQRDVPKLSDRILSVAGWLKVDNEWQCASCSHVLRERIGTLSSKRERQVFDAIRDALRMRRMVVA